MDRISSLPDELLVKILSSVPTKVAVSTSVLSKRWGHLWMWVPNLDCDCEEEPALRDFIVKNLPLRAPIIESLCLKFSCGTFKPEDMNLWVGIAVSRYLRELNINYWPYRHEAAVVLFPSSMYTCISLVTLKLEGEILVAVPEKACLPSLKTLQLRGVTYLNQDSLQLLLSCCSVLEDLVLKLSEGHNLKALVVAVPSLQRLSLKVVDGLSGGPVVVTPSLKYLKIVNYTDFPFSSIEYMPELEEAKIDVHTDYEELLKPITNVKRLSILVGLLGYVEPEYRADVVFSQLEVLKVGLYCGDWSKLVVYFLKSSPKLRVLKLYVGVNHDEDFYDFQPGNWTRKRVSAPECLRNSLEIFEFEGYKGRKEERDFLSFLYKKARCLKSISFTDPTP